jgi:hypothetical protein
MLRSRGPLKTKLGRQKRMRHDSAGSRPRKRDVAWTGVRHHSSTSLRANDYRGFPVFFFHSLHFSARSCRFAIGCSDECLYFLHSLLISLKHSPPVVFLFCFLCIVPRRTQCSRPCDPPKRRSHHHSDIHVRSPAARRHLLSSLSFRPHPWPPINRSLTFAMSLLLVALPCLSTLVDASTTHDMQAELADISALRTQVAGFLPLR